MHVRLQRRTLLRVLYIATTAVLAYAAIGFLLAPYLVERYAPRLAAERLDGRLTLGEAAVNPFLLTLEIRGARLEPPSGPPIATAERLFLDLQVLSLIRRAWVFREVRIAGLDARLAVDEDGRFNAVALLRAPDAGTADAAAGDGAIPRAVVESLAVTGSRVEFTDRSGAAPATTTVAPIELAVTDLSTLPDEAGEFTLSAKVGGGGTVRWRGEVRLPPAASRPLASSGTIEVRGLPLASAWQFVRDELRVAKPGGTLALDARYQFALAGGRPALRLEQAALTVSNLAVGSDRGMIVALETLAVHDARFSLADRTLTAPRVELANGALHVRVDESGALELGTLLASAEAPAASAGAPWTVRIEAVALAGAALHYTDRSRSPPLAADVTRVDASLGLELKAGGEPSAKLDGVGVTLRDVSLATSPDESPVRLERIALDGGRIDTGARTVGAAALTVAGGRVTLARRADGSINLVEALAPQRRGAVRRELEALERAAAAAGTRWGYALDRLAVAGVSIAFADRSLTPPLEATLTVESAAARGIGRDRESPIELDAAGALAAGGRLSATGTLAQDFGTAAATVQAADLALAPLQPLVARYAALGIESGAASGTAKVRYGGEAALRLDGDMRITGMLVKDARSGDRFVAWQRLAVDGVRYELGTNRLRIASLRATAPEGQLTISEQRELNVVQLLKPRPAGGAGGKPLDWRIGRIAVERGTLDFADYSLVLPFSTRIEKIAGAALGVTSVRGRRAELELSGEIGAYGAASARGRIEAADPPAFTDLRVEFENVALPPLSPYTATFAGRKIASGRLWLDLEYRIEGGHLLGENQIVARELRLGERVEAPNPLDLPLDLAVALLTDAEGRVSVAVPVEGEIGDPQFDLGAAVARAFGNLVQRVVTAPFRLLGRIVNGDDAAELRSVTFDPGSDTLDPAEREALDQVARALRERPRLRLVVHGPYDPDRDGRALRAAAARRALAGELGRGASELPDSELVAFDRRRTRRALERMLEKRYGPGAVDAFTRDFAGRKSAQPAGVREPDDRAFYAAMFDRIVAREPLPDHALPLLGAQRARAIVDYLVSAGLDPGRVAAGDVRAVKAPDDSTITAELGLAAMPGAS
jgi:hypothetical protein